MRASRRGQPPIHPRIIAGAILYGLCRGLRSTRKLQEACCYRLEFLWLVEGRQIDYTTFAKSRTRFGPQHKDLFRQLGRLVGWAFDGTRAKANNSRYNTRTAKSLQEKLAALDAQFDQMLAEWDATEAQRRLDERDDSPTQLPGPLADLDERRKKVQAALEKAQALDELRRKDGVNPKKNPAQVPGASASGKLERSMSQAVGGGRALKGTPRNRRVIARTSRFPTAFVKGKSGEPSRTSPLRRRRLHHKLDKAAVSVQVRLGSPDLQKGTPLFINRIKIRSYEAGLHFRAVRRGQALDHRPAEQAVPTALTDMTCRLIGS